MLEQTERSARVDQCAHSFILAENVNRSGSGLDLSVGKYATITTPCQLENQPADLLKQ